MRSAILATTMVLLAAGAQAGTPVSVTGAWARETAPGQQEGAAYFTAKTAAGDRLTAVASPDAADAMLHRTRHEAGMSDMEDVNELTLPPGRPVKLEPSGMHVMLMGLKHPLTAGGQIELDLMFARAGRVIVYAPILPIGSHGPGN